MHNNVCFANQLAPCLGYFTNDILPCVCSRESLLAALSQVALPSVPVDVMAPDALPALPLTA